MEYEHKGVKITFDPHSARFSAVVGGKLKSSGSLGTIKNAIDDAAKNAFKPFGVIDIATTEGHFSKSGPSGEIKTCKVIEIRKEKRGHSVQSNFIVTGIAFGEREKRVVMLDTKENRDAAASHINLFVKLTKEIQFLENQIGESLKVLPLLHIDDYLKDAVK